MEAGVEAAAGQGEGVGGDGKRVLEGRSGKVLGGAGLARKKKKEKK